MKRRLLLIFCVLTLAVPSSSHAASGLMPNLRCLSPYLRVLDPAPDAISQTIEANILALAQIHSAVAHPDLPSVYDQHLAPESPVNMIVPSASLSPGLIDPFIEEARTLASAAPRDPNFYNDFKLLSDLRPRPMTPTERLALFRRAQQAGDIAAAAHSQLPPEQLNVVHRRAFLRTHIGSSEHPDGAYLWGSELIPTSGLVAPAFRLDPNHPLVRAHPELSGAFAYTENMLPQLVWQTPSHSDGSLLPSPYPILIAAPGRFHESYYWDVYFGLQGLLSTNRVRLAQMQVDNFLHAIRTYGLIPNGMRDYYLTRSQPPLISHMVREVYEASRAGANVAETARLATWLRTSALPLLMRDYEQFWMNPNTRYDLRIGLNHFWDGLNLPRPERHGSDREEEIGRTYRDVRAAAESGLDFTGAHVREASQIADVGLNSLLYGYERNLAWMAPEAGLTVVAARFDAAAVRRRDAINAHLWNETAGRYENYNLRTRSRVPMLTANTGIPLFVGQGLSTQTQADRVRQSLRALDRAGGIMSSELTDSPHQWDGANGWAPQQMMVMRGFRNYGFDDDARRIGTNWVRAIARTHQRTGFMYERMNVVTGTEPTVTGTQYPPQTGFLWTNSSYVWTLREILDVRFVPLP